jgi:hypothetical protein
MVIPAPLNLSLVTIVVWLDSGHQDCLAPRRCLQECLAGSTVASKTISWPATYTV